MKDPICGMEVDTASPYSLVREGKTIYFCSRYCLEKFSLQQYASDNRAGACCPTTTVSWRDSRTYHVSLFLSSLLVLSFVFPLLVPFRESFLMYLGMIWWALLLGLLLGGVIDHFVPREYISHILAHRQKRTILRAVVLGFFMSACSHGILALAMQLYKKGASTSAVIAFLLASPWANLSLPFMLIGFFGVVKGLYIVLAAMVIALTTGCLFQMLEGEGLVEQNPHTAINGEEFSISDDLLRRVREYRFSVPGAVGDIQGIVRGAAALSEMMLWWILIGLGLASLAGAYIPPHFFHQYMGPTLVGMLVTLAAATVIEVCSEGTAPVAFEIFRQTGALGNSFVFLMAGVVTDYTEIGLVWKNIGWRAALWLPVITVPQVVIFGILANLFFSGAR